MIFTRSPHGLENSKNFKGADLIIYTEGGENAALTKEKLLVGEGNERTNDVKFWKGLMSVVGPNTKVRIVSVGDCKVLESIALDIIDNNLMGICVAFDRDYRDFWGRTYEDNRIIFTRGYSWESDLFDERVTIAALRSLSFFSFDEAEYYAQAALSFGNFTKGLKNYIRCDQILVAGGGQLFDRKKPASFFVLDPDCRSAPAWDNARIRVDLKKKKPSVTGVFLLNRTTRIVPRTHMYGKSLLAAARRYTRHIIKRQGQNPPPDEYIEHFLLLGFISVVESGSIPEVSTYYKEKITNAAAAARVLLH